MGKIKKISEKWTRKGKLCLISSVSGASYTATFAILFLLLMSHLKSQQAKEILLEIGFIKEMRTT